MTDFNKLAGIAEAKKKAERQIGEAMREFLKSIDLDALEVSSLELSVTTSKLSNGFRVIDLMTNDVEVRLALKLRHSGTTLEVQL